MEYEDLARELLDFRDGGFQQFLITLSRDYAQGRTLVLLELYGSEAPYSPTELSENLGLSSGRIANILKSLKQLGYVSREKDSTDARRVYAVLTEKGEARARELYASQVKACSKVLRAIGKDDAEELVRILKKIPDLEF